VYRAETGLLRARGVEVVTYEKYNDDIADDSNKLKLALNTIWSNNSYNDLKTLLKKERPDVAHFHNIWYQISPSGYYACGDAGVPVVQTLHNFRICCSNGLLLRNGEICEECIGKMPWRSIKYGCYRGSRIYSIPVALAEAIHKFKETWSNRIDAYVALTEFGKQKFIECGLPEEKIFVKPNFLDNPPDPDYSIGDCAVFLGRLSREKGADILLNAFTILRSKLHISLPLKIAGDGPLRKHLENRVQTEGIAAIEFLGKRTFSECVQILVKAKFIIMPAVCYENFPMVIRESFSCGKPVIASDLGAMAAIVEDGKTGLLFEPGNPEDLAAKMQWMLENEDACIQMGRNARTEFEAKYTAEKNYDMLMHIYQKAIENSNRGQ